MKKRILIPILCMGISTLFGCNLDKGDGKIHVTFDTSSTTLKTNTIQEKVLDKPGKVKKPSLIIRGDNPDNVAVYGWYKEKEFKNEWNFKTDICDKSMTLYAKFEKRYTVKYYQGLNENSFSYMTYQDEYVFANDKIPERSDLSECYENKGLFHISNLTENGDGTYRATKETPVDLENERINKHLDLLYIKSENIYFTPAAIKNRFAPVAANSGLDGSTAGSIEIQKNSKGEEYAKVDFGEAKSIADARILIDNPILDVTSSQELEITMKNLGPATNLTFYWVGKWERGGNLEWINGKEYHSFGEDRVFKFTKYTGSGTNYSESSNSIGKVYNDKSELITYQNNQTEDDDWVTYRIPLALGKNKGVSTWGNAKQIHALAIQSSGYNPKTTVDEEGNYIPNVLLIKSIKGIKASSFNTGSSVVTYKGFNDSSTVKNLLNDDSASTVSSSASSQTQVNGFIFPKNNGCIDYANTTGTTFYKKTNNLSLYGQFATGDQNVVFKTDAQGSENPVNLDNNTTIFIKYKNYSFNNSIKITFNTLYKDKPEDTEYNQGNVVVSSAIKSQMSDYEELELNLFGKSGLKGKLASIELLIPSNGVDNLFELYEIRFEKTKTVPVVGYNFVGNDLDGFTYSESEKPTFDTTRKATKFVVKGGETLTKNISKFDLGAYESVALNYIKAKSETGVPSVTIKLTIDGSEKDIAFDTSKTGTVSLSEQLPVRGELSKVVIQFNGTGTIYLTTVTYIMPDSAIDMSNGEYANTDAVKKGDLFDFQYNSTELAMEANSNTAFMYSRIGVRNITINKKHLSNLSLAGKTKIAVVYQNRATSLNPEENPVRLSISVGIVSMYQYPSTYLTCDCNTSANVVTEAGETSKKPKEIAPIINTGMKSGEWAVAYYDLEDFFTRSGANECFLATVRLGSQQLNGSSLFIRGFALF